MWLADYGLELLDGVALVGFAHTKSPDDTLDLDFPMLDLQRAVGIQLARTPQVFDLTMQPVLKHWGAEGALEVLNFVSTALTCQSQDPQVRQLACQGLQRWVYPLSDDTALRRMLFHPCAAMWPECIQAGVLTSTNPGLARDKATMWFLDQLADLVAAHGDRVVPVVELLLGTAKRSTLAQLLSAASDMLCERSRITPPAKTGAARHLSAPQR